MALPGDIATIIVTGTYLDMQGSPRSGTVTFTPNTPLLIDSSSSTMLGGVPVPVALNPAGQISVTLPCTSGLAPSGWAWGVTENVSGAQPRSYSIALPSTLGSTVDISTLTILPSPTPPQLYLLASQLGDPDGPAALNGSGFLPITEGGTGTGTAAGAIAALGVPAAAGAVVSANQINVKWYGAAGDGATNDTTAIQGALNAAAAGGDVRFPYTSAGYLCGALSIPPGVRMLFDKGAKLTAPAGLAAPWIVANPSADHNGTAIIGGIFDATAVTSAAVTAVIQFAPLTAQNIEIRGNTLINSPVNGIFITEATSTREMKWITGNYVYEHGVVSTGFGIYADYIGNVLIDGNTVYTAGVDDSIELGHSGPSYLIGGLTANMRAVNNTCIGGQINYPFSDYCEIANNTVIGNGIQNDGNTANYVQIIGNRVFNAPVPSTSFAGISNWGTAPTIVGNYVSVTQNSGIGGSWTNAIVADNKIISTDSANTGWGIYPGGGGGYNTISGNTVSGGFLYGIYMPFNFSTVTGNSFDTYNGFNTAGGYPQYSVISGNALNVANEALVGGAATSCYFADNAGIPSYAAVTGAYAVQYTDVAVNATGGTFTVTLPTAVGVAGQPYTVKNSGSGVITVATTSSQTIDGASTYTLNAHNALAVFSDGANWQISATH